MEITNDMNIEPIDTSKLLAADIATLGGELKLVVHLIVDEVRERTQISNHVLDDDVENLFLAASRSSTEAFALWMTSGNPDIARQAGLDASQIFGQLAARNDAPLNEVAKRCMRWHDVVALHLTESAPRLGVPDCVSEALAMLQRSLRVTIVRMTESFERERLRMQESLTLQQEKIAFLASHDALTGLPSRSLIMDRIGQLLVRHRRYESDATVIFLDIDDFKAVNDSLGHEAGDHLLKAVGERLGACSAIRTRWVVLVETSLLSSLTVFLPMRRQKLSANACSLPLRSLLTYAYMDTPSFKSPRASEWRPGAISPSRTF
jgi:hypothetical protein